MHKHPGTILISPRVTEKGAYLAQDNCYVFNVSPKAGKREIAQAVRAVYKVVPRMVRVAATKRKSVITRGTNRKGQPSGGKKAYVYLKKGDTIDFA